MDKIKVKITPRISRTAAQTQMEGAMFNVPSLYLNIDDILVASFEPQVCAMEGWDFPPGEDPADIYVNVARPIVFTTSQFYSGASQNLGARQGLLLECAQSIDNGGNPMTASNSPLWNYNTDDEGAAANSLPMYEVYKQFNEAVLSNPGTGVVDVANFWAEQVSALSIERC